MNYFTVSHRQSISENLVIDIYVRTRELSTPATSLRSKIFTWIGRIARFLLVIVFPYTEYSARKRKEVAGLLVEKLCTRPQRAEPLPVHPLTFITRNLPCVNARNHTHRELASIRNSASSDITRYCNENGLVRYDHSTSNREKKIAGSHNFWVMKDLITPYKNDEVPPGALISFVDCDYYEGSLCRYAGHDMCIFTFTPDKLAGTYHESLYRYTSKTTVEMVVEGYARYMHTTWDYRREIVALHSYGYSYIYRVDCLKYSPSHSLVFLTLKTTMLNPYQLTSRLAGIEMDYLERSGIVETKSYLVRTVIRKEAKLLKPAYQLLRKGEAEQVEVGCTLWNQLVDKYYSARIPAITCVDINSLWAHACGDIPDVAGYVFSFLKNALESQELKHLYMPTQGVIFAGDYSEVVHQGKTRKDVLSIEPKGLMSQTCPPLSPESSVNVAHNEAAVDKAIRERIVEVQNNVVPSEAYHKYADEFVGILLRSRNGVPYEPSDVQARQHRPMQRARNEKAKEHTGLQSKAQFFLKADPTQVKLDEKTNTLASQPVRVITQYNPEQCLALSRYTYAFKDSILKHLHWYAPGWTPTETNDRMKLYLSSFKSYDLLETDFSKFDGTISPFLRSIERKAYLQYFDKNTSEIESLLDNDQDNTVKNPKMGLAYRSASERGSGSALTTDGNTIICAFVSYCRHRNEDIKPRTAWSMLGPKAGDDSLDYGNFESYQKVCKDLGLKVTGFSIPRKGNRTVTFLSRTFKGSEGDMSSICDVGRAIRNLHLSSNKVASNQDNFANKVLGYEVTDPNTPIIRNLAALVRRLLPETRFDPKSMDVSFQARSGPYPNSMSEEEMIHIISIQLGLDAGSVGLICSRIDDARNLDDLKLIVPTKLRIIPRNRDLFNGKVALQAVSRRRKITKAPRNVKTEEIQQPTIIVPDPVKQSNRNGKQKEKSRKKGKGKKKPQHDGTPSPQPAKINNPVSVSTSATPTGER